jgi:Tetratricopeptide repeat/Carboxypeptidase regulatory-like domain
VQDLSHETDGLCAHGCLAAVGYTGKVMDKYTPRLMFQLLLAAFFILCVVVSPSMAQSGLMTGIVYDDRGEPIRGATMRAENPAAYPRTLTTTSDQKGRISLVGLRSGQWHFTVEYPGFQPTSFAMPITAASSSRPPRPVIVRMERIASLILAGPLAGVDVKLLRADLTAADEAYAKGDFDAAITGYSAALTKAPALTSIGLQLGNAYRQKKDTAKAVDAFETVLKADPANGTALYELGEIRESEGQLDVARDFYQKAATADPSWAKPVLQLGILASNQGQTDAAIEQLKKVATVDPKSAEAVQAESLLQKISR